MPTPLLQVDNLHLSFFTDFGEVHALNGINLDIQSGSVLGIVGESGSGKSVTAYSILHLLSASGKITSGEIRFNGENILQYSPKQMREFRGRRISMIFQDPMSSLNPAITIGNQLCEAIRLHTKCDRRKAWMRARELLTLVGINEPDKRLKQYPHMFSGGMCQRVMIAMGLACEPDILIADEPTTALDVTVQAQILALMKDIQKKLGMAIVMITHDLSVIADICDEIIVLYAGGICERGTADEIFYHPKHEYTKGLLRAIPTFENKDQKQKSIQGAPIDLLDMPKGCPFAPRCEKAMKICLTDRPEEIVINGSHRAACWMNIKQALKDGEAD